jgi:O-antigen/teichoic acid export membrane protein
MNFILIRRLGPESFGMVAVCITAIITSDAILGPSIDLGVLRSASACWDRDVVRSLKIQKAGLVLKVALLVAIGILFSVDGRQIGRWLFQREDAGPMLVLSAVGVLGLGLLRSVQMHFQIERRFAAFGISDLLQNFIKFGGMALALRIKPAPVLVLGLYVVGPLSVAAGMMIIYAGSLSGARFEWAEARELWREIRMYAATTAVGSTVAKMDVFFVSMLGGASQAGIFSAANTFALIPQLLGMYISIVLTPRIMPLWNAGRLATIYKRSQIWLGALCILTLLGGQAAFPYIARLFLPASFSQSIGVFLLLFPAALCSLLNFPWTVSFLLFFRPRTLLAMDFAGLVVLPFLYALAIRYSGATGAAVVTSGFILLKTAAMQGLALRLFKSTRLQPVAEPV